MSRWITWVAKVTATAALFTLPVAVVQGTITAASSVAHITGDSTWT